MVDVSAHLLFSYGTLQQSEVQLERFGRELHGAADGLPGYRTTLITITDPEVIRASGTDRHPLVIPSTDPNDVVEGSVFSLTTAELAAADDYEVDDYVRIEVTLTSGTRAWAYLDARATCRPDG
ncbi:gamma-glutamylcyclotransferase family protein [Actinoallomurus acaciae]|uniref:Gamma-glutamylcyclotransferase family protein n=1 Tax=Actinoallomurus acaciae TaxID=502577 RepID=A0ABV5YJC6_9ACTN